MKYDNKVYNKLKQTYNFLKCYTVYLHTIVWKKENRKQPVDLLQKIKQLLLHHHLHILHWSLYGTLSRKKSFFNALNNLKESHDFNEKFYFNFKFLALHEMFFFRAFTQVSQTKHRLFFLKISLFSFSNLVFLNIVFGFLLALYTFSIRLHSWTLCNKPFSKYDADTWKIFRVSSKKLHLFTLM